MMKNQSHQVRFKKSIITAPRSEGTIRGMTSAPAAPEIKSIHQVSSLLNASSKKRAELL